MKRKYFIFFLLTWLLCPLPKLAQTLENKQGTLIKSIDVYGTRQISLAQIREKYESDIRKLIEAGENQDWELSEKLRKALTENIRRMGDFAYVEVSDVKYFSED